MSGNEPTILKNLPKGEYTLTEITAPAGYKIAKSVKITIDDEIKKTAGMTDEIITATISKKGISGDSEEVSELSGAILKIEADAGNRYDLSGITASQGDTAVELTFASDNKSFTFTSGEEETVLTKLPAGKYTLSEDTAPLGYAKTTSIEFVVTEDGKITSLTGDEINLVLTDAVIEFQFNKIDGEGKPLADAGFTLTNKEEILLEGVTVGGVKESAIAGNVITFTSNGETMIFKNLPAGSYDIVETAAPEGFEKNVGQKLSFTIDENGGSTIKSDDSTNTKFIYTASMTNTKAGEVSISKRDATVDGSEIAGAELKITLTDEEKILDASKIKLTRDGEDLTDYTVEGNTITFTSGNSSTAIKGLPEGSYTLEETVAPNGYLINKAQVEFTIGANGEVSGETEIKVRPRSKNSLLQQLSASGISQTARNLTEQNSR